MPEDEFCRAAAAWRDWHGTNCDCWRARMPAQPERCNPSARCISPKMLVLATLALLRCAASGHLEFNGTGVAFAAMFTDHSTTADHAVLQRAPEQGTTSAAPFTDAGTKIVPIKTTDEAPDKCEPPMRSAVGPGTQAQQQAFQKCCETMSASATCFATAVTAAAKASDTDDTLALQAALNCSTKLLTVESDRTWLVQPLILMSTGPKHLLLEPGARIEALSGAFHGTLDALLTVFETEDVTIEATGAVFHMRKEDYINRSIYNHSEHRHALNIVGAQGLTVVGLHVNSSGGDGVYVTGSYFSRYCKQYVAARGLTLDSVVSSRNYRQGLSVISAAQMLATNCTFADTGVDGYTSPAAGVDIEPGSPHTLLDGIKFVDCTASDNVGAGFNLSPGYGGAATKTNVTISFDRCSVRGGLGTGFASGTSSHLWPMGHVHVTDCSVSDTAGAGIGFRNVASGIMTVYHNITLTNVAVGYQRTRGPHSGTGVWPWWNASVGAPQTSWPIEISHVSHDIIYPIGQLSITGLQAIDKLGRPFLHADAPRNLTLAQGGLRQITIEGVVESDNVTEQCTPLGIESSAEWAVNLSLTCSRKAAVSKSALKTADEATFEIL